MKLVDADSRSSQIEEIDFAGDPMKLDESINVLGWHIQHATLNADVSARNWFMRRAWEMRWRATKWLDSTLLKSSEEIMICTKLVDCALSFGTSTLEWTKAEVKKADRD